MNIFHQYYLIAAIREFFNNKNFLDVITPSLVENPGMEPHIHPLEVKGHRDQKSRGFLHTSPEFCMKHLLSLKDCPNIFNISYCFRDEPSTEHHRNQFIMLEWYRKNEFYTKIIDDTLELYTHCQTKLEERGIEIKNKISSNNTHIKTVAEIFDEILKIDFFAIDDLKQYIKLDHKDVPMPEAELPWEDYFFLLFLNKIEPHLHEYPFLILKEYPAELAALSTINKDNPKVCDRFEFYVKGVELANCYNELTDAKKQRQRFEFQQKQKQELYSYQLPWPKFFMEALERGLPTSSGIALGVERLLLSLTETEDAFFVRQ